ncbi:MAG: Hpt domain-containing protein [Rhodoferax sp.]|nr:Hpt domain-containing protein [Rhodoferax sp.]
MRHIVSDDMVRQRRLLKKFLTNSDPDERAILAAAASADTGCITRTAHKLKSSARTVGAMALGELCHQLELAGRANDQVRCSELIARLESSFDAAQTDIRKHLNLARPG